MPAEHRNYSRRFLQQYASHLLDPKAFGQKNDEAIQVLERAAALAMEAQKFTLPDGGMVIEDFEFKALDEEMELRLPFPTVALEYDDPLSIFPKKVLLVAEVPSGLYVSPLVCHDGLFFPGPVYLLKNKSFLDRKAENGGTPLIHTHVWDDSNQAANELNKRVVLGFLNALACSNVEIERGPAPKQSAKIKGGIPFDTYHTLVLRGPKGTSSSPSNGAHRSPREHLRRGHIRRLESGNKVWVNATVVNAGAPGRVVKDYKL